MTNTQRFFLQLLLLSAVIGLGFWSLSAFEMLAPHPHTAWIIGYNVLLTSLSFLLVRKGLEKGKAPLEFNNYFMGNNALRLLLTAVVLLVYYWYVKLELVLFTGTFFSCYFIYTIFEIYHLLANLRQNPERLGQTDGK